MRRHAFINTRPYIHFTNLNAMNWLTLQCCASTPSSPPCSNTQSFNYYWLLFFGSALGFIACNQKAISRNTESTKQYFTLWNKELLSGIVKIDYTAKIYPERITSFRGYYQHQKTSELLGSLNRMLGTNHTLESLGDMAKREKFCDDPDFFGFPTRFDFYPYTYNELLKQMPETFLPEGSDFQRIIAKIMLEILYDRYQYEQHKKYPDEEGEIILSTERFSRTEGGSGTHC